MSTLDYILGDKLEKEARQKEIESTEKEHKAQLAKERKQMEMDKKKKVIDEMTIKMTNEYYKKKMLFGMVSTVMFLMFALMHISLSLDQYDVSNMNKFNRSVSLASLPQIDADILLTPKQFTTISELEDYLLVKMNYLFRDASPAIKKKAQFHRLNHIIPYIKLTNLQAQEIECGSDVSNWKGKNKAKIAGEAYGPKFGFPFLNEQNPEKCYATYGQSKFRVEPLDDPSGQLNYSEPQGIVSNGNGMLHKYQGNGYQKVVKFDTSDPNFFRKTIQDEVIQPKWLRMESTLAIIIQFVVYNPNL